MLYIEYIRSYYTKDGILFYWQTAQHLEVIAFNLQNLPFLNQKFFWMSIKKIHTIMSLASMQRVR